MVEGEDIEGVWIVWRRLIPTAWVFYVRGGLFCVSILHFHRKPYQS